MDPKEQAEREAREKEYAKRLTQTRRIALGLPPEGVPPRPPTTQLSPVSPLRDRLATQRFTADASKKPTGSWPFDPRAPYVPGATRRIAQVIEDKVPSFRAKSMFSRPLAWVVLLLMLPTLTVALLYLWPSKPPLIEQRSASDFEKNLQREGAPPPPAGADPAHTGNPGDPARVDPGAPPGFIRMKYSNGNLEMNLLRKEGYAIPEKPRRKDDFLGPPIEKGGSSDIEDRIPEGPPVPYKKGDPE